MVRVAKTNLSLTGESRGESSSANVPAMPVMQTPVVLSNIIIRPANSAITDTADMSVDEPLQLAYTGQVGASTSADPEDMFPEIHLTDGDLSNIDISLLNEFERVEALEASVPAPIIQKDTEAGTSVSNAASNKNSGTAERHYELFGLSPLSPPTLLTPFSGYDSGDDFQPKKIKSSLSSSLKGKAKAKAPQMGVGSFGKGALLKRKSIPSTSTKLANKSSNTENDDSPILKRILTVPQALPVSQKKCKSVPKLNLGCTEQQVKTSTVTSVESAGNTAGSSGLSNAVLPTSHVAGGPILHVTNSVIKHSRVEPDVELEVFSQADDNHILRGYRQLRERVQREYTEDLANVQRSEENFQRLDEAFKIAQEARRVALETLEKHRRALDKSSRKKRQFE